MTLSDEQRPEERVHRLVHDIRQCLHVIGMATGLLQVGRADDPELAELCESIEREQQTAVKLLDELGNVARKLR